MPLNAALWTSGDIKVRTAAAAAAWGSFNFQMQVYVLERFGPYANYAIRIMATSYQQAPLLKGTTNFPIRKGSLYGLVSQ